MKDLLTDMTKRFMIFVICTILFYAGFQFFYTKYEQNKRYEKPKGAAVKVFMSETSFIDRLNLFFQLGE